MEWTNVIIFIIRILTFIPKRLSRPYRQSRRIQGKWKYHCILKAPYQFLDGGNMHGGECTIKVKTTLLATQVSIRGERIWFADYDNGKKDNIHELAPHIQWESEEGAFLSDDRFIYKYKIGTNSIEGISIIDIDKNSPVIKGLFYYFPDDAGLITPWSNFETIFSSKPEKVARFFKASGTVVFERIK